MAKKTKSAIDLTIELLAALQTDEYGRAAELRLAIQDARDLQNALDAERVEKLNLRHENGKLRKKLARVTASATAAHKELAEYKCGALDETVRTFADNSTQRTQTFRTSDGFEFTAADPCVASFANVYVRHSATNNLMRAAERSRINDTLSSGASPLAAFGTEGLPDWGYGVCKTDTEVIAGLRLPMVDKYGRPVKREEQGAPDKVPE
jgi:hypothetical protein